MTTPELQLRTLYVPDGDGRLVSTREPRSRRPPAFVLVRGRDGCAWGVRAGVPDDETAELTRLANDEPAGQDLGAPPVHADRYTSIVAGRIESGPAFAFPAAIDEPDDVVSIEDARFLGQEFRDLEPEIDERAPVVAVIDGGCAVSICACARRTDDAAEASLYTLETHRGRGFGPRVTAAWALAIRASGRVPLYSTAWTNDASLAVARKLGLVMYASDWNLYDD